MALMKRLLTIAMLLGWVLVSPQAKADQNDDRLQGLFEDLQAAQSDSAARSIEARIWSIWYEHPDSAIVLLMRQGRDAMRRQDYSTALRSFDQVVIIDPAFAEGWNARATLYYLIGNFDDSLTDIDRVLALEPRHFGALSGRGLVYVALDEWDLALGAFEEALAVNPRMTSARLNAEAIRKELEDREI